MTNAGNSIERTDSRTGRALGIQTDQQALEALRIGRRGKVSWRNAERVRKLAEDLNAGRLARGAGA